MSKLKHPHIQDCLNMEMAGSAPASIGGLIIILLRFSDVFFSLMAFNVDQVFN
jgi:hypothetical protein